MNNSTQLLRKKNLIKYCIHYFQTMIKAFLQVIHAGHIPMTDCPEQINHMIHCFIDLWAKNGR